MLKNIIILALAAIAALIAWVSLAPGFFGFEGIGTLTSFLIAERGARVETDISYGRGSRRKLDLYLPSRGKPKAAVLFLYGGGWQTGDKALYRFVGSAFAARGIAAVIPDYSLFPENRFPVFVEDAANTYAWTARQFQESGIPIFIAGHSAGAHSGALIAYDTRYLQKAGPGAAAPAGFIGLAGPYAFDPTTYPTTKDIFATASKADDARPVAFVSQRSPPTLILHGLKDEVVGLWNAQSLTAALTEKGVRVKFVELPDIGHIGIVLSIARPFRWRAPVLKEILEFIGETMAARAGIHGGNAGDGVHPASVGHDEKMN